MNSTKSWKIKKNLLVEETFEDVLFVYSYTKLFFNHFGHMALL